MSLADEIAEGLVLHLDPHELEQRGGVTNVAPQRKVQHAHFFVCLSESNGVGRWLPCYTNEGVGRFEISEASRSGHAKWVAGECWFHPAQIWEASHVAVVAAALAAHDQSTQGNRNWVNLALVEHLPG